MLRASRVPAGQVLVPTASTSTAGPPPSIDRTSTSPPSGLSLVARPGSTLCIENAHVLSSSTLPPLLTTATVPAQLLTFPAAVLRASRLPVDCTWPVETYTPPPRPRVTAPSLSATVVRTRSRIEERPPVEAIPPTPAC